MQTDTDYIKDLTHIRSMMERSSRFISLSGLAGVCAGVFALAGVAAAYWYLDLEAYPNYYEGATYSSTRYNTDFIAFFVADAVLVLLASLAGAVFFTTRKAKRNGLKIWDKTAMRLVINMAIPLMAGGLFCLALFYQGALGLIVPATLIFYGLALLNGSKYTLNDIRYLGICEIALGVLASFFIGYGLVFWAIGFGVLHIIYGAVMYFKYERA
ncbi:MAG: hypothetical protein LPJ89_10535 [Hymenobacteraceae bacterium]|nr:hypothetical protein [Hymenobacteraceae bacterium]MDX5444204.1 hypothetical protein [Hymenobacteraceae bacterium]MDX5512956.1 hypothetical protein [Hymenobacteraceae bacterium]